MLPTPIPNRQRQRGNRCAPEPLMKIQRNCRHEFATVLHDENLRDKNRDDDVDHDDGAVEDGDELVEEGGDD